MMNPIFAMLGLSGGELVILLCAALLGVGLLIGGAVFMVWLFRRKSPTSPPMPQPPLAPPPVVAATVALPKCPKCRQPLPENALEGLCPACLARVALGTEPATPGATININRQADAAPGTRVPPNPAQLASQFPQLEIIELLGMGGMGMVYKARQARVDRLVALKILPVESSRGPSFAERFQREAKALAKLNHPGIVTFYDFGQTSEYYYFIMEYVDGMNLRQLLKANTLEPRQALELVTQICAALQFAHDEGVVHRDIKPENILLNKKGQVKIADFGLAKLLGVAPDTALTMSQAAMGTFNYMAPEQRENAQKVDHRADIYSLGVVFYEMLTGEVPMGRFEAPSKRVQVDVRLDEVVLKALEREPARRYQQVSEVKSNVETITSTTPPVSPNVAATPRMAKIAPTRFPFLIKVLFVLVLVATVVVCLTLLMGFGVSSYHQVLAAYQSSHGTSITIQQTIQFGLFVLVVLAMGFGFVLWGRSAWRRKKLTRREIQLARERSLWPPPAVESRKKFELFSKEWSAAHAGHSIRVHNSWNRGMKLFVDDVCQASTKRIFALDKSKPVLRCEMASGNSSYVVEVYAYAVLEVYAKIVVNGKWIGGDNF